jgi:hypothetical protein
MTLDKKRVEELQKILEKEHGRKFSYEETEEAGNKLVGLIKLLMDVEVREQKLKHKLIDNPKGFELDNPKGRSCIVCGYSHNDNLWYDHNGAKCMSCQKALDDKIIPPYVCHHKDSFYSLFDLEHYLHIKSATARKLIRNGIIKARIVEGDMGNHYVILLSENENVLPRKSILSGMHAPVQGEEGVFRHYSWDECQKPKDVIGEYEIFEHIKYYEDYTPKYKLVDKRDKS